MGVNDMKWDAAMVEAALFRSGGVKLENYAYGPATNPAADAGFRSYKKQGSGVGHAYVHLKGPGTETVGFGEGLDKKSRYVDQATMVAVLVEILNSATGKAGLAHLDANEGAQVWLHDATAVAITGAWYGIAPNETGRRKIMTASINMRSHGDALFISSTYPEQLQAAMVMNVNAPVFVPKKTL